MSNVGESAIWTRERFFEDLRSRCPESEQVAEALMAWAHERRLTPWWGSGKRDGSFFPLIMDGETKYRTFSIWTDGRITLEFRHILKSEAFAHADRREELRQRLLRIGGLSIAPHQIATIPRLKMTLLSNEAALKKFVEAFNWAVEEIRKQ